MMKKLIVLCLMLMLIPQLIESISLLIGNMDGYMKRRYGISGEIVRRG